MTDRERIFESTCRELSKTIGNQLTAYHEINQRAVDLAKIDLLAVSVVVTGLSLSKLEVSLPLLGGLSSLLYALWSCVRVYEPRSFARGLGAGNVEKIDSEAGPELDLVEHYRNVMFAYERAIDAFTEYHREARESFRDALWSSLAAISFFAIVALRRFLPRYPESYDVVWVVLVPVVMLWGKDKYGENTTDRYGH